MKRLFLLLIFIGLFVTYLIWNLKPHYLNEIQDEIEVTLIYQNESNNFTMEPYSELGELLSQVSLGEDVDYEKINPKKILAHKDVINIPIKTNKACISINHALEEELITLKGIGLKTAQSIIEYRSTNGLFQELEDLMQIKGIGIKKFEKIVEDICL